MSLWRLLLDFFGLPPQERRTFELDAGALDRLQALAERERRRPEEVAAGLLVEALDRRALMETALAAWESLSPREQQVAALICLNCTNREIAARLGISPETVKSHIRSVLSKFGLHSKQEMRRALSGWDFSGWEPPE